MILSCNKFSPFLFSWDAFLFEKTTKGICCADSSFHSLSFNQTLLLLLPESLHSLSQHCGTLRFPLSLRSLCHPASLRIHFVVLFSVSSCASAYIREKYYVFSYFSLSSSLTGGHCYGKAFPNAVATPHEIVSFSFLISNVFFWFFFYVFL